jgi:hypothetical protein
LFQCKSREERERERERERESFSWRSNEGEEGLSKRGKKGRIAREREEWE